VLVVGDGAAVAASEGFGVPVLTAALFVVPRPAAASLADVTQFPF
jgi:hypothetical protein